MSIYLVALNEDTQNDWRVLKQQWPGRFYVLNGHLAFVAPQDVNEADRIATILGMSDQKQCIPHSFDFFRRGSRAARVCGDISGTLGIIAGVNDSSPGNDWAFMEVWRLRSHHRNSDRAALGLPGVFGAERSINVSPNN